MSGFELLGTHIEGPIFFHEDVKLGSCRAHALTLDVQNAQIWGGHYSNVTFKAIRPGGRLIVRDVPQWENVTVSGYDRVEFSHLDLSSTTLQLCRITPQTLSRPFRGYGLRLERCTSSRAILGRLETMGAFLNCHQTQEEP